MSEENELAEMRLCLAEARQALLKIAGLVTGPSSWRTEKIDDLTKDIVNGKYESVISVVEQYKQDFESTW